MGIVEKLGSLCLKVRLLILFSLLLVLHLNRLWRTVNCGQIFMWLDSSTLGFSFLLFHLIHLAIFLFQKTELTEIINREGWLLAKIYFRDLIRVFWFEIIVQNRKRNMADFWGWLVFFHYNNTVFTLGFFGLLEVSDHFVELLKLKLPLLYFLI